MQIILTQEEKDGMNATLERLVNSAVDRPAVEFAPNIKSMGVEPEGTSYIKPIFWQNERK